jgi:hypothetical protein
MVVIGQRNVGSIDGEYLLKIGGNHNNGILRPGKVYFLAYGSGSPVVDLFSSATVNDGKWHQIVAERNGSNIRIYIDGSLDVSGSTVVNVSFNPAIFTSIGKDIRDNSSFFNGQIDDIKVWSTPTCPSSYEFDRVWTAQDASGNQSAAIQHVTVQDNTAPVLTCAGSITVSNTAGQCGANVSYAATATDNCSVATVTYSIAPGSYFAVGTTTVTATATDECGKVSTCNFTVTVQDNEKPTISAPAAVVVNTDNNACAATGVALGTPTTGDNCPLGVNAVSNNAPASFPKGATTITWTVTDASGNTATATQTVTVEDHQNPEVVTQNISVTLNASGNANITAALVNNGSFDNCTPAANLQLALDKSSFGCSDVGNPVTVTLMVKDASGNSASGTAVVTVVNNPPVVNPLIPSTTSPIALGSSISFIPTYSDVENNITSATISWDDAGAPLNIQNITSSGTTMLRTYAATGVYTVTATVKDPCNTVSQVYEYVVVYDPNGNFVTGGGFISSPLGAYTADPTLTGRANFGFVSKYQKGTTVPSGKTEFQFHAAGMNFNSTVYQWLVVSGATAQFKGSGTINGGGDYGFLLSAVDGQVNGGGGVDKFRIKIWNKATGAVVYDNQMGAADDAVASTAIAGGSIVIHSTTNKPTSITSTSAAEQSIALLDESLKLEVAAMPNPSRNYFRLVIKGGTSKAVNLKVIDVGGRVVELRNNISAGQILQIGNNYGPGVYFVEVTQGTNKKQVKLIKL